MKRGLGGLTLAFAVFCVVCGGPFGLEAVVSEVGAGMALVLILLTPIVWAIPDALTTAELAAAIPEEGGYVVWVRRAMGSFAAFLNAWWSWLYTLVDAALYPGMFVTYLAALLQSNGFPFLADHPWAKYATCLVVIALFTWLNLRGTKVVGLASSAFTLIIVLPFVALAGYGAWRVTQGQGTLPIIRFEGGGNGLAVGLAIVMWNYLGWDALSTVAEEVDRPEKAYPRALAIGVPLVTAAYFLPTYIGLAFFPDAAQWKEGAWPAIATAVGGKGLGLLVNFAGLVSPLALFTATLLGSSRVPFVLAEDGFLPKWLLDIHPKYGTPWRCILLCGVIYAALVWQSFKTLVALNVVLYGTALVLELLALVILRFKEPELPRPFRVPGGWVGLGLVFLLPTMLVGLLAYQSLVEEGLAAQGPTIAVLISAPVIYLFARRLKAER
ncbi:APC family permease [bacterium]|nr:MAG: APC family permease [bacterium]